MFDFLLLLLVAGICGSLGQAIGGYSHGGCLVSIVLGFIGALLGMLLQRLTKLPELFVVPLGETGFPVIWSIIGAALFVAVLGLLRRKSAAAVNKRDQEVVMSDSAKPPPGTPSREDLKAAFKAFKKRLKFTRLDAESKISGSPLSGGRRSDIVAIVPPHEYPPAVWEELARQGKLKKAGVGMYELVEP